MHSEYTIYNVFKSMQRKKKDLKLENDSPFTCTKMKTMNCMVKKNVMI